MISLRPTVIRRIGIICLVAATVLPRFISLGTTLTIDEPLWQSRGDTFIWSLSVGNFEKTLVAGQPGVTTAWLAGLTSFADSLRADQAGVAALSTILILLITYFLVQLWGFTWGMVGGFFLALDPFLIGHSRLVHTDALLALFYLASIVTLLAALEGRFHNQSAIRRYIVLSAILGGAALLTKIFAVLLIPTVLLIFIYTAVRTKLPWQQFLAYVFLWGGVFILTTFILWPALWTGADAVYDYLFERVTYHAEGTRSAEVSSAWWYYIREAFFRFTPGTAIFLILSIFGLIKGSIPSMRRTTSMLFLAGFAYAAILSVSADKGDRYILFALTCFTLVSVYGLRVVIDWLKRDQKNKHEFSVSALVTALVLGALLVDVFRLHPYYLAHYNRLYPIETTHKLGWGEGLEQAAAWITENDPGASVSSYFPRVFSYFYDGSVDSTAHVDGKDYLVLYRSMFERAPDSPETDLVNQYLLHSDEEATHTIYINGLPYAWIFKLN